MTDKMLVEVFASLPLCSGGRLVKKFMKKKVSVIGTSA